MNSINIHPKDLKPSVCGAPYDYVLDIDFMGVFKFNMN